MYKAESSLKAELLTRRRRPALKTEGKLPTDFCCSRKCGFTVGPNVKCKQTEEEYSYGLNCINIKTIGVFFMEGCVW